MSNIFNRLFKKRAKDNTENLFAKALYRFMGMGMPVSVDDSLGKYISDGYCYNPDVFAIISRASKECAKIPAKLVKYQNGEMQTVKEHELLDVIHSPNPFMSRYELIENSIAYKKITGNTYIYKLSPNEGSNKGKAKELHVMPAHYVTIKSGNYLEPVSGYVIDHHLWEEAIPADMVLHVKEFNPNSDYNGNNSHLYGMSPLRAARNLLRASNDGYLAKMKMLQNTGAMGIFSGESLDFEQAKNVKRKFKELYTGANNKGETIITNTPVTWQPIGMNSVEMELLEGLKLDFKTLCDVFDIPAELFARSDKAALANQESARRKLITSFVMPELDLFYEKLTTFLCTPYNSANVTYKILPDYSQVPELQDNIAEKVQWIKDAWWLTVDEKREKTGYEALGTGETSSIFIPQNLKNLADDGQV